ncbi:MAG TPA: hypothetical protein DEH25_01905 [Chloroflexi bacterium]|nr:hypothetical protein [Chloroflexota bacterium]
MRKSSLSEDTLLQMLVAAITATLARLAKLRTAGSYQESLAVIDEDLEELLGLKGNLVRQLEDQRIVEMLTTNEFLDVARLYYVAELFLQESQIRIEQGEKVAAQTAQVRALNLFLEVCFAVDNEFLEADAHVDELFEALGTNTPEDTLFTLFDYYEQAGAYDRAEAAIETMLQTTGNEPAIVAEKQAFYKRLLAESDDELEAGGITREHLRRAYQQFL